MKKINKVREITGIKSVAELGYKQIYLINLLYLPLPYTLYAVRRIKVI
jgi:hypothetical protein